MDKTERRKLKVLADHNPKFAKYIYHYLDVSDLVQRLNDLVQYNQEFFDNPPAGSFKLYVIIQYLEREIEAAKKSKEEKKSK